MKPADPLDPAIRAALTPRGSRLLPFARLATHVLGPDSGDEAAREALRERLLHLESRGELVRQRGEKWSLTEFTAHRAGYLSVRGEGRAWLLSGERDVPDTPIVKGGLGGALDGDFVLVRVEKEKPSRTARPPRYARGPREVGTVVKVLVRKRETVVGRVARGPEGTFVVPYDPRIDVRLRVPEGQDLDAPTGIWVEARILVWPDKHRLATAEVIETIGFDGEPGVDVEVVARKHGIPRVFPEAVVAESEAASGQLDPAERAARADYTRRVIVTIDGETARDFDDAIEAEELPGGGFRIGVHIADVSWYVQPGSALDAEAWERGTSVYFPDRAIPMLPERLSNDLCSLRPDEERRTVSAILTLDAEGEIVRAEFTRSLIRSRQRLTYTAVGAFLEGKPGAADALAPEVAAMLPVAARAAKALGRKRERRGSLDFDLPDADVILGETGDVVAIVREVRNEAHRLVEEFMLAANEAVARHLVHVPSPALYRVHDRPDARKLEDLRVVLGPMGYDVPEADEEVTPAIFQKILAQAEGQVEERFVSDLVLRCQRKALYHEECRGHYALAATHYCHFTSPIRRYPDLLVHRALVEWVAKRHAPAAEEAEGRTRWLAEAGPHCSDRERRAEAAEREALAWKKFVYLKDRVGEEFDAYVSAAVPFGLFIVLDEIYVDGLIPMDRLEDDFYRYEEVDQRLVGSNLGRVYRLGDRLRVVLVRADADRRTLEFAPATASRGPRMASRVAAIERRRVQRREGGREAGKGKKAPPRRRR
ncbi:MAG: ribonuclease R [Acidobacteria bacterium]|nr:MAG: ribonuclease R [Acidobacteriota bacterium]